MGRIQNVMLHEDIPDYTGKSCNKKLETRVTEVARETSVLGRSAFEAQSFLRMRTTVIAVLQGTKKQRNMYRLWSVRDLPNCWQCGAYLHLQTDV